ncbi:DUF4376 domain-containing protein [Eisenbergiella sp.]
MYWNNPERTLSPVNSDLVTLCCRLLSAGERNKMLNLKYIGLKNLYPVSFKIFSEHVIEITGELPAKENGFELFRDEDNMLLGQYGGYTTIYRMIEGGIQFSDDGSVWIPPEPIPEPEPVPEPTLEELREAKVAEMNTLQQAVIQSGVNVTLTDGTVEHFTLTEHDQTSLVGLQSQVAAGEESIPWHTSNEGEHCKFYSNANMGLIIMQAMAWVTWHVTYFRDLRIYIRSLETKEEVAAVAYGMELPEKYQSEPLKVMIAAQAV